MHGTMLTKRVPVLVDRLIDPKPHRSRLHYGLRVLYLGPPSSCPNTLLGAGITFQEDLIYSAGIPGTPAPVGRVFSHLSDQRCLVPVSYSGFRAT